MRNTSRLFTALASAVFSAGVLAQAALPLVDGEVRKVDLSAQKITLKHGEIKNLDMPGMSMVFKVKDPALLDKVKAGDRVQFTAEDVNGALTVVSIERVAP
ncbi:MAG: copper-binding protein [Burkholderiales bacterium]|nr:copper-binding protein [Burkholderiales bacterium]